MGLPYDVTFAGHTDVGKKRGHNEDSLIYDADHAFALVADGMGGHQAGEVASNLIVDIFTKGLDEFEDLDPGKRLMALIERSNDIIYRDSQESTARQGMGSTITCLLLSNRGYHVVNVGDSRTYLLRQGELIQITDDHSFVQLQVQMGLLSKEDSRHSKLRHILTRSIGGQPTIEADLFEGSVASGDLFLLCTDGFHQGFSDEEIEDLLNENHNDLESFAESLVHSANERDGSDNISVILAKIR
ncbi:MAG TPA: Stp1/IreP family PP2C-type Ser/Thr phosphatase [Thermoanaerobaculia bacterium]|nr:Stp1/IreP family PP2C-type Ser/Thr phosphatase [Thermoanaerobaculia bacterium]HUM28824.1 Stp1/IreP family PP2C-type Ser/Thr phosphatase [Thermoanaerobaculia bacterium]HXK69081.1 Stp1/IreP family PP2C-type Ser/Thr phosphatase [Thermoanaerobaculia bacterium]